MAGRQSRGAPLAAVVFLRRWADLEAQLDNGSLPSDLNSQGRLPVDESETATVCAAVGYGRTWDRTRDLPRVKETRTVCAGECRAPLRRLRRTRDARIPRRSPAVLT